MDKQNVVSAYSGILFSLKKEGNSAPACTNLEDIMPSEISQRQIPHYRTVSLICKIFKKETVSQTHRNKVEKWLPEAEE